MTESNPSTGRTKEQWRPIVSSRPTESSSPSLPSRLPPLQPIGTSNRRVLDFDLETVAAGFADPQWVPNRTVCWAFAWADERKVTVDALPVASFYDKQARRRFLLPLLAAVEEAGVLTGHNLIRFDLPILRAECLLLGLPSLGSVLVQDTIRVGKAKGFKKGMDNVAHALGVEAEKMPLNWAQWEAAYGEDDLSTVKERCASDVLMHLEMRDRMIEEGWLAAPKRWNP